MESVCNGRITTTDIVEFFDGKLFNKVYNISKCTIVINCEVKKGGCNEK